MSKTWGDDLAEYVNLLAVSTPRLGGVDPETLRKLLDTYADEICIAYHVETEERTYSEAVILKFWRTDAGSAQTSQAFPVNILPLAQRLGGIIVALSQKRASLAPFPAINPEVSSLRVAPHHFPSV